MNREPIQPPNSTDALEWHNAFMAWLSEQGMEVIAYVGTDPEGLRLKGSAEIAAWFALAIEAGRMAGRRFPITDAEATELAINNQEPNWRTHKLVDPERCETCDGTGEYQTLEGIFTCSECRGTGRTHP